MRSAIVLACAIYCVIAVESRGQAATSSGLVGTLLSKTGEQLARTRQKAWKALAQAGAILVCTGLSCEVTPQSPVLTSAYAETELAASRWNAVDTIRLVEADALLSTTKPRLAWHTAAPLTVFSWNRDHSELLFSVGENYSAPAVHTTHRIMLIASNNTVNIILTFDDGPDTRRKDNGTRHIIDTLQTHAINAVFFIQSHARSDGNNYFRGMEEKVGIPLVEQMHANGHIIAAHTGMDGQYAHAWKNRHPRREAIGALAKDLERCKEYIRARTGAYPRYVRPPFGEHNPAVRSRYAAHDLQMILWDIDSLDTKVGYDRHDVRNHLQNKIKNLVITNNQSLVILFHDIDKTTNSPGNLHSYIIAIDNAINTLGFQSEFNLSRDEIHQILEDY